MHPESGGTFGINLCLKLYHSNYIYIAIPEVHGFLMVVLSHSGCQEMERKEWGSGVQ